MKKWLCYKNQRGAFVLEYVLLLVACVAMAGLIRATMVNRDPNNQGFVFTTWEKVLQIIAEDTE